MMHRFPGIRFLVILMIAAVPFAAFAAEPVGRQTGGGSTMDWQLNATGHDRAQLRWVGPDGETGSIDFPNGRNVTLQIRDLGTDLVDGQYNYELRLVPKVSKDLEKKLQAARAANDDKAARKALKDAGIDPDAGVMSGTFTVQNGAFVSTEGTEGGSAARPSNVTTNATRPSAPIAANTLIPDDLIVQGSICTGFDCVNGESFGFDTIRLKENNTRIKFMDTSVGSFPTTDWQLTANDSASGGANKFSIEDVTAVRVPLTIEGSATTNSIYVDSTGRVGFRTSTPVLDLHVATSNTPGIRLEQNNSGGFTAQTWDIAGNEANFFVRDVTGGSRLPFRIRPQAPTSSIDISADGDVGIGTGSPEVKLHVFSTNTADSIGGFGPNPDGSAADESAMNFGYAGASFGRAVGFFNIRPDTGATAPNPSLRFLTANVTRLIIDNEGFLGIGTTANPDAPIHYTNGGTQARLTTAGVWQDASSRDAKENILDLDADAAMEALRELKPVRYNYKVLPTDPKVGFIAEDVPEIVATPEREGLSALDIVAVVTKVVQEQQKTVQAQQQTIEQLTERIAQLEKERQQ